MNTHVNFETAKLLKEKGFNEWCKSYYRKNLLNSAEPVGTIKIIHSRWKNDIVLGYEFIEHHYEFYAAPTIAEVVMWIYKKHGIWISVYTMDKWLPNGNDREQLFDYSIKQMKLGLIDIPKKPEEFNSPEEAYEAAIKHCLTKLI